MSRLRTVGSGCAFLIAFAISPLAVRASPVTYNPVSQFSINSDPNIPWTYGYGVSGAAPITLFTASVMASGAGYVYEGWSLNGGDPVIGLGHGQYGTLNSPVGDLLMHPGNAETLVSILVFTAPTGGTYSLSGLFERIDTTNGAGTGTNVTICRDTGNCNLYTNYLSPSAGYLTKDPFNLTTTLSAGETLDFEVSRTSGNYDYDSTGLQLNITTPANATATPEPSALALLGIGLAGLCGVMKRKLLEA